MADGALTPVSLLKANQLLGRTDRTPISLNGNLFRGLAGKIDGPIKLSDMRLVARPITLQEMSSAITAANGWVEDATYGMRKDRYTWNVGLQLSMPAGVLIGNIRRIEMAVSSFYNTPASNLGENYLLIETTGGSFILGTVDSHSDPSFGQLLAFGDEGDQQTPVSVQNRKIGKTIPSDQTVTSIKVFSNGYNGNGTNYAFTLRGMKDIVFYLKE